MFQEKLDFDLRKPVFCITLAWAKRLGVGNLCHLGEDVALGLLLPKFEFWKQLGMVFGLQTIMGMIIGSLVHVTIVQTRESCSFSLSSLMGYGIFIPSLLVIPIYLMQWLDVRNSVLMVVIGGAFGLQAMRCISAIHGTTTPIAVEKKRFNYCIYFCSIVDLKYDSLTGDFLHIHNRLYESMKKLKELIFGVINLTIMYSIMEIVKYKPFPNVNERNIFQWKHLINNLSFAYMWHLCLLTGATSFQFALGLVTGIESNALTRNPLFGSVSPSDFWGRRWNNVVHKALKDSVYRSMIPNCHIAVTTFAVFFVSGLLHEYVLFIGDCGFSRNANSVTKKPQIQYGIQTAFFSWNAIVLLGDYMIGKHPIIKKLSKSLPQWVVSLLVVMTVLPIAHLFSQGMMDILLLEHYKIGYPMFVLVEQSM